MDKHDVVLNFKKPQKKPKKKKNKESSKSIKLNVNSEELEKKREEELEKKKEEEEKRKEQIKKEEEKSNLMLTMDLFGIDSIDDNDTYQKENNEINFDNDEYDDFI
jgi:predicted alpha/beta superfamily hydrolase